MGGVTRGLFDNETVTMLGLARVLSLILVRGCGAGAPALQDDTIMLRAAAVASAITHAYRIAPSEYSCQIIKTS